MLERFLLLAAHAFIMWDYIHSLDIEFYNRSSFLDLQLISGAERTDSKNEKHSTHTLKLLTYKTYTKD